MLLVVIRILLASSIIAKAYLHTYLANVNGDNISGGSGHFSIKTLWYYSNPVSEEYRRLKYVCNVMQSINLIVLIAHIIFSLIYNS